MTIWDEAVVIRDQMVAAGVRAVTDPRRVDPPCVLVVPAAVEWNSNCIGDGVTDWVLHVLGPQPGGEDALRVIARMAAAVLPLFPEARRGRMTSYSTDSGDDWPCFDIEWSRSSPWV